MLSWYAQKLLDHQYPPHHLVFVKYVPLNNCSNVLCKVCSFEQLRLKHPLSHRLFTWSYQFSLLN